MTTSTIDDVLSGRDDAPAPQNVEVETKGQNTEAEASSNDEADNEPEAVSSADGKSYVPLEALQSERKKRQSYTETLTKVEQRLAENEARNQQMQNFIFQQMQAAEIKRQQAQAQQTPAEPEKTFWDDPDGYLANLKKSMQNEVEQRQQALRNYQSRMFAEREHSPDAVKQALDALGEVQKVNPQAAAFLSNNFNEQVHPYGALVEWHKRAREQSEFSAPDARQKLEAEIRAKVMEELQQAQPSMAASSMPGDFATTRNVGARSGQAWSGPANINDIFAMDRASRN